MDQLVFPDGRKALTDLLDGKSFAGWVVAAGSFMPLEAYNNALTVPFVMITTDGGNPSYVDHTDQLTLQVNGPGGVALSIAQDIRTQIVGDNIDTAEGFLDAVKADRLPTVSSPSDQMDQAVLLVSVISRPIN